MRQQSEGHRPLQWQSKLVVSLKKEFDNGCFSQCVSCVLYRRLICILAAPPSRGKTRNYNGVETNHHEIVCSAKTRGQSA